MQASGKKGFREARESNISADHQNRNIPLSNGPSKWFWSDTGLMRLFVIVMCRIKDTAF